MQAFAAAAHQLRRNGNYSGLNGLCLGDTLSRISQPYPRACNLNRFLFANREIYNRVLDNRQSKAKIPGNSRESIPFMISRATRPDL
jgi:hypothetical protein